MPARQPLVPVPQRLMHGTSGVNFEDLKPSTADGDDDDGDADAAGDDSVAASDVTLTAGEDGAEESKSVPRSRSQSRCAGVRAWCWGVVAADPDVGGAGHAPSVVGPAPSRALEASTSTFGTRTLVMGWTAQPTSCVSERGRAKAPCRPPWKTSWRQGSRPPACQKRTAR